MGRFTLRPLCGRNDLSAKRVVAGISSVRTQRNTAGSLFTSDKRREVFANAEAARSRVRPASFEPKYHNVYEKRPLCWDYQSIINYSIFSNSKTIITDKVGFSRLLGNLIFKSLGRPSRIIMHVVFFINWASELN